MIKGNNLAQKVLLCFILSMLFFPVANAGLVEVYMNESNDDLVITEVDTSIPYGTNIILEFHIKGAYMFSDDPEDEELSVYTINMDIEFLSDEDLREACRACASPRYIEPKDNEQRDYDVYEAKFYSDSIAQGLDGYVGDIRFNVVMLNKTSELIPGADITIEITIEKTVPAAIIDFISSDDGYGLVNLTENYDNTATITTYLEGKKTGYTSNGNYGDVITFYKNGLTTYEGNMITPVTHRAMAWVDVIDKENGTYYIPEIDTYFYGKIELAEIGLGGGAHIKDLEHSGYITKGDSIGNPHPDQLTHYDIEGERVQPVQPEWIIGIKTQQFDCRMETGSNVIFEGRSLSSSTITDYLWESSIDGELSKNASFNTNSLSMGRHIISFTVRDDSGLWSSPASATLVIVYPKADDDDEDESLLPSISLIPALISIGIIALRRRY